MGQYFLIVNLDKKEYIKPTLMKLWEICANNTIRVLGFLLATNNWDGTGIPKHYNNKEEKEQIINELKELNIDYEIHEYKDGSGFIVPKYLFFGRWCCDRVALIGDYAQNAPNAEFLPSYFYVLENYTDITERVIKEFNHFIEIENLKITGFDEYISPDIVITASGGFINPKIKTKQMTDVIISEYDIRHEK
jgi:hypothetical protein